MRACTWNGDARPAAQAGLPSRGPGIRVRTRQGQGCPPARVPRSSPPRPPLCPDDRKLPLIHLSRGQRGLDTNRNRKAHVTLEAGMRPPPALSRGDAVSTQLGHLEA